MVNGRVKIYTDVAEITNENVIQVLTQAFITHLGNSADCNFLINYEIGWQPLQRIKTYRSDIDVYCNDNVANEIVEFKLGFNWGNPITFVQRGQADSGIDAVEMSAIALLNEQYDATDIKSKTQELARFIEITGLGYTYVDLNTDYEEGDSYFTIEVLDPRNAFIVRSSSLGHKPMMGVTYRQDTNGNYHFTCFTKDRRYEIDHLTTIINNGVSESADEWQEAERNDELNPLGMIPIIEWQRSHDRMGCFERQVPEMDNLNLMVSDFSNDVDQNTQAIFHANDIEFPTDANGNEIKPSTGDWLMTQTTQDGRQPFVTPLAVAYDYNGMLKNIVTRRGLILQKCNVPQRDTTSGGSSGVAVDSATGWNDAEVSACKEQEIIESCKMQELRVVLKAIHKSKDIPQDSPLLKLRAMDVKPSIKRQKTYELSTKANAFATLVTHGISGIHALNAITLFDDNNQVWADSRENIEKYQASIFDKANSAVGGDGEKEADNGKIMQDLSDQTASPNYSN